MPNKNIFEQNISRHRFLKKCNCFSFVIKIVPLLLKLFLSELSRSGPLVDFTWNDPKGKKCNSYLVYLVLMHDKRKCIFIPEKTPSYILHISINTFYAIIFLLLDSFSRMHA